MGYWFTIIGALFKLICDLLLGMGFTGESAEFAQTIFTWLGFILSGIGVIKALLVGEGLMGKLKGVAIHALIWVIVLFGLMIVLPIIILGVVIFLVDVFLLGSTITTFVHDRILVNFGGGGGDDETTWPIKIYNVADSSKVFIIEKSLGDKAEYSDGNGNNILISIDDVNGNHINTIYGTFTW